MIETTSPLEAEKPDTYTHSHTHTHCISLPFPVLCFGVGGVCGSDGRGFTAAEDPDSGMTLCPKTPPAG